jgi:hypothetical protein
MMKKLEFAFHLYIYKVQCMLGLKRSDIMTRVNNYYRDSFRKLDKSDIAVILPHCLISEKCPGRFSKSDGILCKKCDLCRCGEIYEDAENKGYQFYITPSVGFTKRLINRKSLKGIIGVACDYEIDKGIASENFSINGVHIDSARVKTQGIRLHVYDCIHNSVDWEKIKELM